MLTTLLIALFFPQPSATDRATAERLIANLGDRRYVVRENAARDLTKLGSSAKATLAKASANTDPEIGQRCKAIRTAIIQAEVESLCPMPFIDAIWYDTATKSYQPDDTKYRHFRAHLNAIGADGRPWDNYRWATYAWASEQLGKGVSPRALRPILAAMHAKDEVFIGTSPPREDELNPPVIVDWRAYLLAAK